MEAFGVVVFFISIIASLAQPIIGIYTLFFISYVRPQDFNATLTNIEPARIIIIATFISFLFHRIGQFGFLVKARQNIALLGLLAVSLISWIVSIDKYQWWVAVEDFLRIVIVYFIFINVINTEKRLKMFYVFFILMNLFIALRFFISYRTGTAIYWGSKPGDSTLGFLANADDLGVGLVVALSFILVSIFYVNNFLLKALCAMASIGLMLGVLATKSRGALLAIFIIFIFIIISNARFSKLRVNKYAIGFFIVLILFAAFIYKYHYAISEQYVSAKDESDPGRAGRASTWVAAQQMIKENPILGVGRGNFIPYWQTHYPPGVFGYQVEHNIIYEVAAEIGIPGLILFLYFSFIGLFDIKEIHKKYNDVLSKNSFYDQIFMTYIVSLIGFYVSGSFITVAFYWHIYVLVAIFVCAKSIFMKKVLVPENAQ